jgi:Tfp pilus assembly PilM family ATPase/Tfp pilus assembly protein PilN
MFTTDKRYLSISINETAIKIAQVRTSGAVEKISRANSAGTSPDDLIKAFKSALVGFNRKASVLCVIPANLATSKSIEVPSSDPKEIRSIINLQASRHTPYSREEVLIGYINLGPSSAGNTKIFLVIVHRNIVTERLNILEKSGLALEKVLFVPEGIGRLYSKGLNLKSNSPLGIIDFSTNSTNFLVAGRGSAMFARSIPMGIKHMLEVPDSARQISEELVKSLEAYQSEDPETVVSFVITTDNAAVKSILPLLQTMLKVDVRFSPYANLVKMQAVKNKLKELADESFLDVIAPVVALAKSEVNLMPEEMRIKRNVEQQGVELIRAGVAALLLMLLLGAMIIVRLHFKEVFLNKNLREHYAAQKEEVTRLQERMGKSKIIREYLHDRMVSLETIHELYQVTPIEIYLNGVAMDEDGTITLSGVSQSMSQVFSYVKALDDSPLFVNAKTKSTSTKKEAGKDMAIFEITLKLDAHKE